MKRTLFLALVITATAIGAVSCGKQKAAQEQPQKVQNVILMVGDGMGVSHVTQLIIDQELEKINMERAHAVGLVRTFSANNRVTDSSAAGTAMATGTKTNNSVLGISPEGDTLKTILERAEEKGLSTGIVVTCTIPHATPGAFYGHVGNRRSYEEIAAQLLDHDIDVVIGAGLDYFTVREDGRDLVEELRAKDYTVVAGFEQAAGVESGKLVAITTEKGHMPYMVKGRGDYLPQATAQALDILTANSEAKPAGHRGFFMMVEGSLIDYCAHDNDAASTLEETRDFDKAVGVAFDYADKHSGTLVVVLADHETGGLTLPSYDEDFEESDSGVQYKWSTGGHSASMIALFAYGAGAHEFTGVLDNTDVPKIIARLLEL